MPLELVIARCCCSAGLLEVGRDGDDPAPGRCERPREVRRNGALALALDGRCHEHDAWQLTVRAQHQVGAEHAEGVGDLGRHVAVRPDLTDRRDHRQLP